MSGISKPTKPCLTKLRTAPIAETASASAVPSRLPLVRRGFIADSERWRDLFQDALMGRESPEILHAWLDSGVTSEAWRMLPREKGGAKFRSFDQFCRTPAPWGLGRMPEEVHSFLASLLGERRAALATVAPAMRGVPRDPEVSSRQGGGNSERHEQRLRAVKRAPEVVRRLYEVNVLGLEQAAVHGRQRPTPQQEAATSQLVASLEPILAELGDEPAAEAVERAKEKVRILLAPKERHEDKLLRQPVATGVSMQDVDTGKVASTTSPKTKRDVPLLRGVVTATTSDSNHIEAAIRELHGENPESEPGTKIITLEVSEVVHHRLQAVAAERGTAIDNVVLEGIALLLRQRELQCAGSSLDCSASVAAE